MLRTGVRANLGIASDWVSPAGCGAYWQVGRSGNLNPVAVLQGAILIPSDGPGRKQAIHVRVMIPWHLQLSTVFLAISHAFSANPLKLSPSECKDFRINTISYVIDKK